jgi:hypothetical protein
VRSEVITAVKITMSVFWVVGRYRRFRGTYCPFRTEEQSSMFLQTLESTYKCTQHKTQKTNIANFNNVLEGPFRSFELELALALIVLKQFPVQTSVAASSICIP